MRAALVLALVLVAPGLARADAYAWGGSWGRVSIMVLLSGFHEGAGSGGWEAENARWFLRWATRLDAMLPAGAEADVGTREADGEVVLNVRSQGGTETFPLGVAEVSPGDPALDRALDLVSRRFHVPVPAAPTGVRLYTVQLLAAAQPSHAAAFVQSLDTRVPASEPDFFWEACAPCYPQIAHVLEDGNGARRVVVGMYADRAAAHRAASELRARGLPAHVRVL
ncbi:MAG: SPOR domain-containing protein [Sandaracinus sp.]